MKKKSLTILSAIFSLSLIGCTTDPSSTEPTTTLTTQTTDTDNTEPTSNGGTISTTTDIPTTEPSTSSSSSTSGEPPILTGYYANANGLTGYSLKTSLFNIIKGHSAGSYDDAQDWLKVIDKKANGTMWDMYSDVPGGTPPYTFAPSKTCGSYNKEGDCWNREHIIPQSVFSEKLPMKSDVHHLYATDGYVNGQRSNYPFGEVQSASWTSKNGSKKGSGKSSMNYTGTVFEPIDEYKGDIARAVLYMSVRYQDVISGWKAFEMFDKSSNKVFTDWAIALLLKWHNQDPVSTKEIDRNNSIYNNYQHNRNPFVDYPQFAEMIWG